ncbi:MAG: YcjF family protein [Acholeplasmatales bacterium]|jgi:hypothetical protein|nr:YcjF family protein [Acholeplasmatales bacterium]
MKKEKNGTKAFWIIVGIGFLILFGFILLSSVLDLGEKIRGIKKIGPYAEYAFYGVAAILAYLLVIRPIAIIVLSPAFSVETTLDASSHNNGVYKMVAKRLLKEDNISSLEKERIKASYDSKYELRASITHAFNHFIKKEINKTIRKNAKTVLISTAISQNARVDSIATFLVNLKMIKEIVYMCGFRPSYSKLAKLAIRVVSTSLIAEGLEGLEITELLPSSFNNVLAEIPFAKVILSSITQGIANALLTIRIGVVTRKYLFSDAGEMSKDLIRRGAFLEAVKILPMVIWDSIAMFPKSIANLFKKPKQETENE